jgi:hypothetical protein
MKNNFAFKGTVHKMIENQVKSWGRNGCMKYKQIHNQTTIFTGELGRGTI